ncbi:hypothetical protein DsansV1_C33g0224191 [Dioscorea sansibarensis]
MACALTYITSHLHCAHCSHGFCSFLFRFLPCYSLVYEVCFLILVPSIFDFPFDLRSEVGFVIS